MCVFAHHILFIHSPADGHLDGFHVLAVVNSAGMNTGMCVHAFSILLTAPGSRRSCDHVAQTVGSRTLSPSPGVGGRGSQRVWHDPSLPSGVANLSQEEIVSL